MNMLAGAANVANIKTTLKLLKPYDVGYNTLRRWIDSGAVATTRAGHSILVNLDDVSTVLNGKKKKLPGPTFGRGSRGGKR